jgi:hypothetical protein
MIIGGIDRRHDARRAASVEEAISYLGENEPGLNMRRGSVSEARAHQKANAS